MGQTKKNIFKKLQKFYEFAIRSLLNFDPEPPIEKN